MTIGEKLRRLRIKAGMNVAELSERSGIHKVGIYNYEKNATVPSFQFLQALAKALDFSWAELDGCSLPRDRRSRSHKKTAK